MPVAEELPEKRCPRCGQRDRTTFSTCRYCGANYSTYESERRVYQKQYAGGQGVFLSFYSPAFYLEVGKWWTGVGYLYLCSLLFVVSLVYAIKFQVVDLPKLERSCKEIYGVLSAQMPKVTIDNGHLSIDKTSPYTIRVPIQSSVLPGKTVTIIFDTRDQVPFTSQSDDVILVTADNIYRGKRNFTPRGFERIDNFVVDRSDIKRMWDSLSSFFPWSAAALFSVNFLGTFIVCVFQSVVYASIGRSFSDRKMNFATLVRLSSVAMTPAIILQLILRLASIFVPFWGIVSIFIVLAYLYFAVVSSSES